MVDLPRGTVTFLFSDIEGSTRLAGSLGEAWLDVLEHHRRILREAFAAHAGHEVKTEGDGFFVAFASAVDAVRAAAAAQRGLAEYPWAGGSPIRVRIGIHTGDATVVDDDYVGLAVHHAARIAAAAHGGQTVMSEATRQLVGDLDGGLRLDSLGPHRLKDIDEPVLIHQVTQPEMQSEFPPLRAGGVPTNLPVQLTSFVGREEEQRVVEKLLRAHRLVTLTGAGGAGKTRLALEVAAAIRDDFLDGVWLVELARVTDPAQIWQAVADAVGIRAAGAGQDAMSIVTAYFATRRAVLVLDNCEHVISAVAGMTDALLRAGPDLRVLATSREALGIAGEHAWRVPSLDVPESGDSVAMEEAWASTAVRLFVERADAVGAAIGQSSEELAAIVHICRRLDGMPLGIELAAARARSLPPTELAARLDDRFRLLTGGSRTAMPRQQTLQALVDWSHELLDGRERAVLRRCSVFVGGFTLEAAEAVCAGGDVEADDVLDVLDSLVAKSLVLPPMANVSRFGLLETIRAYARQKLLEAHEVDVARDAHLAWVERLAAAAAAGLGGAGQVDWLQRVDAEHENLRGALEWATETSRRGAAAIRALGGTWRFWWNRGYWAEAREWAERGLRAAPDAAPKEKAQGLWLKGYFAGLLGDLDAQHAAHTESLALAESVGDMDGMATALYGLGWVAGSRGDPGRRELYERGAELAEKAGNDAFLGRCLIGIGNLYATEHSEAVALLERATQVGRRAHDAWIQAAAQWSLANVAIMHGDWPATRRHLEAALGGHRVLGDVGGTINSLSNLAWIALWEEDTAEAEALAGEAIALAHRAGLDHVVAQLRVIRLLIARRRGDADADGMLDDFLADPGTTLYSVHMLVFGATNVGLAAWVSRAVDFLTSSLAASPSAPILETLGQALWSTGDPSARTFFERARELDSDDPGVALGLARCALDRGDPVGAAELLGEALERFLGPAGMAALGPMFDGALCTAAEVLAGLDQPVGAARLLGVALSWFRPSTPPHIRERAARVQAYVRAELGESADAEIAALEGASPSEIAATFRSFAAPAST